MVKEPDQESPRPQSTRESGLQARLGKPGQQSPAGLLSAGPQLLRGQRARDRAAASPCDTRGPRRRPPPGLTPAPGAGLPASALPSVQTWAWPTDLRARELVALWGVSPTLGSVGRPRAEARSTSPTSGGRGGAQRHGGWAAAEGGLLAQRVACWRGTWGTWRGMTRRGQRARLAE